MCLPHSSRLVALIAAVFCCALGVFGKPSDKHLQFIVDRYDFVGMVTKTTNPNWNSEKRAVMSPIDNKRAPDDGDIIVGIIALQGEDEPFECHVYVKKLFGYDFWSATVYKAGVSKVAGKSLFVAHGKSIEDAEGFIYTIQVISQGKGYDWKNRKGRGY